jgi:ligand-binding sensor domain-containing protein/signal transduction histidine kinase
MVPRRRGGLVLLALSSLWFGEVPVSAERLSTRAFGLEDGLPSESVTCVVPDSRGFLWFCTSEGLARFDGTRFKVYTTADGLPHRHVTAFLEGRDGTYWVGTAEGLAHFDPKPSPGQPTAIAAIPMRAVSGPLSRDVSRALLHQSDPSTFRAPIYVVHEDPDGVIWCGTGDGVFRITGAGPDHRLEPVDLGIRSPAVVRALITDRRGSLWIGTHSGLYRRTADGLVTDFGNEGFLAAGVNHNVVMSLLEGRDGWIWVGTEHSGLRLLAPDAAPGPRAVSRVWFGPAHANFDRAAHVMQASDGAIWWVGLRGVRSLRKRTREDWADAYQQIYGSSSGMGSLVHDWIAEDATGDLWIAGEGAGVTKVTRRGFTTYTEADGLATRAVHALTGAIDGAVVAVTAEPRGAWHHNRFDGDRFEAVRFNIPHDDWGWGWSQLSFQDRDGRWWLPTGQAVYRAPRVARFAQLATAAFFKFPSPFPPQPFLRAGRLITDFSDNPFELQAWAAFRLFQDSRGVVWAGTMNRAGGHETPNELVRWDPATDRFAPFPNDDESFVPMSFAEDRAGGVWIGGYHGGLRRVGPGLLRLDDYSGGIPRGQVRALLVDRRGRLWIGTSDGGVARIDTPAGGPSVSRLYSSIDGLTSLDVSSLVDDERGRIYVGHARGIDVIEADDTVGRNFTAADGLAPGAVWTSYRDRHGSLWFGTQAGLSRFEPGSDRPRSVPQVTITAVSVGGRPLPISEVGEREVPAFTVPPESPAVQVQYAALGAPTPAAVRYQFRLEGGPLGWSAPSSRQSVEFANLAAGSYRVLLRAVSPGGQVLSDVGVVPFTVQRPVWARWWFLSVATALFGAVLLAFHRARVARAVAVERLRLRLARDLHDDLGSNLARLAILGEVALRDPSRVATVLADVSTTARRLVETLGEVVWLVDPRKDDLASVIDLVAAHGREVFEPQGVVWTCTVPREAAEVKLAGETRKELYLVLKEAVTNAATHAQCATAELTVHIGADAVHVDVRDDGRGLPAGMPIRSGGNGLPNMQARAAAIGAELRWASAEPGTRITLIVPRRTRRARRARRER